MAMPQKSSAMDVLRRNVVRRRTRHGLSQTELAEQARISRQTLSKIESGDGNVTVSVLERVAVVLGCEVKDLFERPALLDNTGASVYDDLKF
jgi:transcriptional regulator with XRE-family HTH domain